MEALSISKLVKTYKNNVSALKGIDLKVQQGDFFALLGPNGAGKSTTIGIITSLVNKTSGQVKVFGYDIDQDLAKAKACIGLVPQEFNFSIFEEVSNIIVQQAGYYGVPRKRAKELAHYYIKRLGLWEKRREMARNLSGGMKRRLMIARALVHQPALLILDEPTAGVDIEIRRSMWEFLLELNQQGTTIILTTHYLEEAENLCKHIAIIDQGQIVINTTMKKLLGQLNIETFLLDLRDPIDTVPDVSDFAMRLIDETTLEVEIKKGQQLNDLFDLLSSNNLLVSSMKNKANRLEELFVRITTKNHHA